MMDSTVYECVICRAPDATVEGGVCVRCHELEQGECAFEEQEADYLQHVTETRVLDKEPF